MHYGKIWDLKISLWTNNLLFGDLWIYEILLFEFCFVSTQDADIQNSSRWQNSNCYPDSPILIYFKLEIEIKITTDL